MLLHTSIGQIYTNEGLSSKCITTLCGTIDSMHMYITFIYKKTNEIMKLNKVWNFFLINNGGEKL